MTMRLGGRAYDSFVPAPIGERAKWTIEESDQRGPAEWLPFSGRVAQDGYSASTATRREAACRAFEWPHPELRADIQDIRPTSRGVRAQRRRT
jgi:hypothetical protein